MGPNWGESLAHAGGEVLGGYLSGKADRADEALDEDRSDVALAKATQAQAEKDAAIKRQEAQQAQIQANWQANFDATKTERELNRADRKETAATTSGDKGARERRKSRQSREQARP